MNFKLVFNSYKYMAAVEGFDTTAMLRGKEPVTQSFSKLSKNIVYISRHSWTRKPMRFIVFAFGW